MIREVLVPDPWRSLAIVLVMGLLGSLGGMLTGPSSEPLFRTPPASDSRLRETPQTALLKLEDVLPLSASLEIRPVEDPPDVPPEEGGPNYQEWGRAERHRAAFWRPDVSAELGAPIEVHSETTLYKDAAGAQRAFTYWTNRVAPTGSAVALSLPADQAAAFTVEAGPFTHQWVQFRQANGVGFLLVTGLAGHTPPEPAADLAKTMAERMR